jgi:3',5'-cyclic AMP phosphodiesterase CpdA
LFSFGLLADVQYADDDTNVELDRHFRGSPDKLRAALKDFDRHPLAFVAHLGDLVDHDLENAPVVLDLLARCRVPVHHVLGNHDFRSRIDPSGCSDRSAVLEAYGMTEPYSAFDCAGWRFLLLDTNEVGVIENAPGTPEFAAGRRLLADLAARDRPNAHPWNGTLGAEQRGWLAEQLLDADRAGLRAAVLAHHPVHPDHHDNLLDDHELKAWLAGFDALRVWFNGHQHAGGYGRFGRIHFLTLHGVVQSTSNAYAVVATYADRMVITGYGREESRTLAFD